MGYVQKQAAATLYFTVKYHSICEISRKPREGFEEIKVPDISTGEELTKFIRRYERIAAMITAIEWRDTKQQYVARFQSWEIHLLDEEGVPAVLRIPFRSNASDRFMKLAENLDFSKPVEFRAWKDTSGDKDKTAFRVMQDGQTVLQKYKKGEMGDCPEGEEGLDGWNFAAQRKYLHGQVMNVVIPRVQAVQASLGMAESNGHEPDPFADEDEGAEF